MSRQLTRPETDRVIARVAGGIAQRFGFNSTGVRLAWVVSVPFGGFGILVYVIVWIVLPNGTPHITAIRIAEERYARGQISAAEFGRSGATSRRRRDGDAPRCDGVGRSSGTPGDDSR